VLFPRKKSAITAVFAAREQATTLVAPVMQIPRLPPDLSGGFYFLLQDKNGQNGLHSRMFLPLFIGEKPINWLWTPKKVLTTQTI
jgi:hypothetical protein